jgi:hypothetical protein
MSSRRIASSGFPATTSCSISSYAECDFGHLASVCSRSVGLAYPFLISLATTSYRQLGRSSGTFHFRSRRNYDVRARLGQLSMSEAAA